MIYLDNAATSFPKPPEMLRRMVAEYTRLGVSPGRGGYDLAVEAGEAVQRIRARLARFFGAPDPERVIFAANATDALNLAIQGMLRPGDHVVSTRLEHNSVLRPLHQLSLDNGIGFDLVPFDAQGLVDPDDILRALTPHTRLVVVSHASNVLGTIQPVAEIGRRLADKGIPFLIDTAQSAGHVPVDLTGCHAAAVAFTGHKSLMGPPGIGGLVLAPETDIRSTRFGGTGVDSRSLLHTQDFPHRLEAGTINLLGILGLDAGLDWVESQGLDAIHRHETALLDRLQQGITGLDGIEILGGTGLADRVGVLTVTVRDRDAEDVGAILDGDHDIAVRAGLHCAPLVHTDLGSLTRGAIRFSIGPFNTEADIDAAVAAMKSLAA